MATVTSFEGLERPSKSELRQFAELFAPLFSASSVEARRQAVAALSQCPNVPGPVAYFIATQPIDIAAPFIAATNCLDDQTLITIARTQGIAHARAIVRREALSPTVIDALVGLRQISSPAMQNPQKAMAAAPAGNPRRPPEAAGLKQDGRAKADQAPTGPNSAGLTDAMTDQIARDEALRQRLRALTDHVVRPSSDRLGLRTITPMQEALLVRFARNRETDLFATTLADTLSASRWLSERIMLDISGLQLATTLKGVAMARAEGLYVLERLYQHLGDAEAGMKQSERLWDGLDLQDCAERLKAWERADRYTYQKDEPIVSEDRQPAIRRTTASHRAPIRAGSRNR